MLLYGCPLLPLLNKISMANLTPKQAYKETSPVIDFESLLSEFYELNNWNKRFSMSVDQINKKIESTTRQTKQLLEKVVLKLKAKTDVESKLQGIIDLSVIVDLQEFIDDSLFIYETEFKEENRKAQYFGGFIVLARANYDRSARALVDLCNGYMPDDFVSIFHERIHRTQRGLRRFLKVPDESKLILEEIHAYKGENEIYPFGSSIYDFFNQIMIDPAIGIKLSLKEIKERVATACFQIDRLMAQGVTHKQIGKLIQKTHWDIQKACFKDLEKSNIDEKSQDGLVDKMKIQRKIDLLKIKRITQEIIKVIT